MDNKISFIISAASAATIAVLSYKVAKQNTTIRVLENENTYLWKLIQKKNHKYKRAIKKLSITDQLELAAAELEDIAFDKIIENI